MIIAWLLVGLTSKPILAKQIRMRSMVRIADFSDSDVTAWSSAKPDRQSASNSSESLYPLLSANWESHISSYRKSIAMLNNIGDKGPPWGTPRLILIGFDFSIPIEIST